MKICTKESPCPHNQTESYEHPDMRIDSADYGGDGRFLGNVWECRNCGRKVFISAYEEGLGRAST